MLELNDFLPKDDIVDEELFNQLKIKLENPNIHNIGIIGNYGAGKSSFIKSFFNWYENKSNSSFFDYDALIKENRNGNEYKYHFSFTNNHRLRIAKDFSKKEKIIKIKTKNNKIILQDKENIIDNSKNTITISLGKLNSDSKKITSKEIEKCILNQIIYSVDGSELPNSRINRIEEKESPMKRYLSRGILFLFFSIVFLIIFCLFRYSDLAKYGIIKVVEPKIIYQNGSESYIKDNINQNINIFLRYITLLIGCSFGIVSIISFLKSKFVNIFIFHFKKGKISTKYGEAEIEVKKQENYLNNFIDELINFFINTKYRIIIFEDIDRFGNEDTFLHLRDLNQILNKYFANSNLDKITFIYSVRSDIFSNKQKNEKITSFELVKFFDFCIPIIPYANALNIGDLLLNWKNENISKKECNELDSKKILLLSSSIQDVRVYKNIINEYQIYCYKLQNNPRLNFQEIFSLIVLKNTDFSFFNKLETESKKLNNIKNVKKHLITKILKKKKAEADRIEKKNNQILKLFNKEITMQQVKYLREFYKKFPKACSAHFIDAIEYFETENETKLDILIHKGKAVDWEFDPSDPENPEIIASASMDVSLFEQVEIDNKNYYEAFDDIDNKYNDSFYEVSCEREKYQESIDKIYSSTLKDLYENYNTLYNEVSEEDDEDLKKKDDEILSYILKGFITEDYDKSISYFYEGQLSTNDILFINAVKGQIVLDTVDFELTHIDNIINELSENFGYNKILINEQLLNYSLFLYLIENRNNNIIDDYLSYLKKKKKYAFITMFITKYKTKQELILTYIFQKDSQLFYNFSKTYEDKQRLNLYKIVLSNETFFISRNFNNSQIKDYLAENMKVFSKCSAHCKSNLGVLLKKMST